MSLTLVVGMDISKDISDRCILAPDNSIFKRVKIHHNFPSIRRSLGILQETEKAFGMEPVIVRESTSHCHRRLWKFLTEAGYEVTAINPPQSDGLKNINVRKVKYDKMDANKIATLYQLKMLCPSIMYAQAAAALRALGRRYCDAKQDIVTCYTNRLTAILDQAFLSYEDILSKNMKHGERVSAHT